MRYHMFLAVILTMIGVGLYAMHTGKTAGDLCRNTGSGLVAVAHYVAGPDDLVAAGSHIIAKGGHSLKDGCTHY